MSLTIKKYVVQSFSRAIVYDLQWQLLRMDMKGTWDTHPGVSNNIKLMEEYLRGTPVGANEYAIRLKRVINLCNAILLGWGNKPEFGNCRNVLGDFRDRMQRQLLSFHTSWKHAEYYGWDWEKVQREIGACSEWGLLAELYTDLQNRVKTCKRRLKGKKGEAYMEDRQDLQTFLDILEARLAY